MFPRLSCRRCALGCCRNSPVCISLSISLKEAWGLSITLRTSPIRVATGWKGHAPPRHLALTVIWASQWARLVWGSPQQRGRSWGTRPTDRAAGSWRLTVAGRRGVMDDLGNKESWVLHSGPPFTSLQSSECEARGSGRPSKIAPLGLISLQCETGKTAAARGSLTPGVLCGPL